MNIKYDISTVLSIGKLSTLSNQLTILVKERDWTSIDKLLKGFYWMSHLESLNESTANLRVILQILNLAFCGGPDAYTRLFQAVLTFIMNLVGGLHKMRLLTNPDEFHIKEGMFAEYGMFKYTDGNWRSGFSQADLSLKNELLVIYRNVEYATQLTREMLQLYPSTLHSLCEIIFKSFPNKNFNYLYKYMTITNLFYLVRNNNSVTDAYFTKLTEFVVELEMEYVSEVQNEMEIDTKNSPNSLKLFSYILQMCNHYNFCHIPLNFLKLIYQEIIFKVQQPRFVQFLYFDYINKSQFLEQFVDWILDSETILMQHNSVSIHKYIITLTRMHHFFSFVCRSINYAALVKRKMDSIFDWASRVYLYYSEQEGDYALQLRITFLNGIIYLLQFYHQYYKMNYDNLMLKVVSSYAQLLEPDLVQGFIQMRKMSIRLKSGGTSKGNNPNGTLNLFIYDLHDEYMAEKFGKMINYSQNHNYQ